MYYLSHFFLIFSFVIALGSIAFIAKDFYMGKKNFGSVKILENAFLGVLGIYIFISAVLLNSLITSDFLLVYTASYTDLALPFFYKLTAFWAGQAGSLLFWQNIILLFACCFMFSNAYKSLHAETKTWYWFFLFVFIAFFSFLLITWNNPFIIQVPQPMDGNGLNPLLQDVAMIIHPPLLLSGYAGFVVPACMAFAFFFSSAIEKTPWTELVRPTFLITWMLLSAGILLGAWWAYMELGWGGYWAWDPVENASFLPWLIATAYIHTALVQRYRNKLHRTNFFLITLAVFSTIFATYIVRGGIVESVHAFAGSVGTPLILFVIFGIAISLSVVILTPPKNDLVLDGIHSKEAVLVLVSWFFLVAAFVIATATLFPVLTRSFTGKSIGLDARFYNDVVLPLFIVINILLTLGYAMTWKKGLRSLKELVLPLGIAVVAIAISYIAGYRHITALLGIGSAVASLVIAKALLIPSQRKYLTRRYISATLVHIGFAIIVFGIAFSGPFKAEKELELKIGQSVNFEGYQITYEKFEFETIPDFTYYKAFLQVRKNGKDYGTLTPEKRVYPKYDTMSFAEASTIPSLYKELYSSLLNIKEDNTVFINMSVLPFVNWIWIGSVLLCLAPLFGLFDKKREKDTGDYGKDREENIAV